jgi:methylenetetrahydrofolate reductase (NADPH)|tara:strand:+ start:678 stop:1559 length:882 start_codon:yes stop_codon:yes gene_type:complete
MIKEKIISLIDGFTIELNPKVRHKINSIPLEKKNNVYITYLPDASENDILETIEFVSKNNLTPITHLPARTMKNLDHVRQFLSQVRERTDSKKILVIGGGGNQLGQITSSLEILNSGLLEENNFNEIGIAGHPEGSPDISQETIDNFLNDKFELTKTKGLSLELVTQFFFNAAPFINWCEELTKKKITIPVRVGFPGPASFKTLLNFGLMSGVGNSINFLKKNSSKVSDLLTKTSNDEMLISLAEFANKNSPLKSFHCFPFGGFEKTCLWLNELQKGEFTIENQQLKLHKKIF